MKKLHKKIVLCGIGRHFITLFAAAALLLSSAIPSCADSLYEQALNQLTDPAENRIEDALCHPLSEDERLNAKTDGYRKLLDDGVQTLWELNPDTMRTIALNRFSLRQRDAEAAEKPQIIEEPTEGQLMEMITADDIEITEPAPMYEKSWYEYQLSDSDLGYKQAQRRISGYMFSLRCDGKYLALMECSYRKNGSFRVSFQAYPNSYYNLYRTADEASANTIYPILLTDPKLHQAIAFLVPNGLHSTVYMKNYISSSSKDEILDVDTETFLVAAGKWNRDTLSMLLDADGNVKKNAKPDYNNLESYVRSELRIAYKEHLLRAACIIISCILVIAMTVLILNKRRIRFLDEDDPRRKWQYFIAHAFDRSGRRSREK